MFIKLYKYKSPLRNMTKKKVTKKKTSSTIKKKKTSTNKNVERILVENFVDLQRVMAKLSERFDALTLKISELLELFEDSAKILVKKEIEYGKDKKYDEEILDKMEKLLNQNKIIAKGLTLIHEKGADNQSIPEPIQEKHKGYSLSSLNKPKPFTPQKVKEDYDEHPNNQEKKNNVSIFEIPE